VLIALCLGLAARTGNVAWAAPKAPAKHVIDKTPQEIIDDLKNHGFEVKLKQEDGVNVFVIESVNAYVLTQLADQQVQVTGIIGGFSGIKQRYRFSTDDGSRVIVNGVFKPNWSGTRWTLRTWVVEDVARVLAANKLLPINLQKPVLTEVEKCQGVTACGEVQPGLLDKLMDWIQKNPLVVAGIAVILIALIVLFVVMDRNKKAEQARLRAEEEKRRAEENRRQEEIRREEERRRQEEEIRRRREAKPETEISGGGRSGGAGSGTPDTQAFLGSLKAESGPLAGVSLPLAIGETKIGKSKDCQIVLDQDPVVSRNHGSIKVTIDGRVIYKDDSTNGSYVNGQLVQNGQVDVSPGSKIEIGSSTFTVVMPRRGGAPAPAPVNVAPASAPVSPPPVNPRQAPTMKFSQPVSGASGAAPVSNAAPPTAVSFGAELEVLDGPEKGQRFPISKPVTTFGREARDILLSDAGVSRSHATLTLRDGKFILADDGSTHGTKVNGEAVDGNGRQLVNGDEIVLGAGNTKLKFRSIN
jgi:pSer/pThr/pTyr-binding forkhead associated (FHA) protein